MLKIEVEHRGILTRKNFNELRAFFDKKGKFLGLEERFSVIYSQSKGEKLSHSPIDLKLRITNKKAELVLKHGKWSGKDARKEFIFPIEKKRFGEMVEFLKILGHYRGVLQATKTYLYYYKGVEFSLVEVPGWGYYFEAEIAVNRNNIEKANGKIKEECRKLELRALSHKEFCQLLNSLNNRPGFRFNFKKEDFSEIKKRFNKYF